jgi:hypothetical protein
VQRHVARLVTQLVVDYFASRRLIVDYFASLRLLVDYFAYAARPRALARRAVRQAARRRLIHLRRASGCFGSSRGLSRETSPTTSPRAGSSSTTSPTPCVRVPRYVARLVIDYFDYATRPVASARRAGSSSTTSPPPRVRVPRHVARLIRRLVVDYFASHRLVVDYFSYTMRLGASAHRAARRRLL